MQKLIDQFQNPDSRFRGKPFWAWNGKLSEGELRWQIRAMKKMGLGGFFMHSRVGLSTPYLSKEWMELVKACVDEAEKQGMEAWLYDEDRWPSGAAGGLVTKDPAYRHKNLKLTITRNPSSARSSDVLGIWMGEVDDDQVFNLQKVDALSIPELSAKSIYLIFSLEADENSPWFNGYTYLDTMNHEAVKKYIEVTHEAYRREISAEFGKNVPGIFTDEPYYGHAHSMYRELENGDVIEMIPWTPRLPEIFQHETLYLLLLDNLIIRVLMYWERLFQLLHLQQ